MGHVEIIDALISHGIDMSAQTDVRFFVIIVVIVAFFSYSCSLLL